MTTIGSIREVFFGGVPHRFATLAETITERHGLCRLSRDQIGDRVRWYVRMGIDERGTAMRGGMPFKRLRDARRVWAEVIGCG